VSLFLIVQGLPSADTTGIPPRIRYDLLNDIQTPGVFHLIEVWESQTHLTDHLAQPHMQEYFAKSAKWQSSPPGMTHYEIFSLRSITMDD
jgi:quinol monooxygenase YgiN